MGNIAERFKLKNAVVKKSLTKPLVEGIPEEMLDRSAGNDTSTTGEKAEEIFFKVINNGDMVGLALNIAGAFLLSIVSLLVKILKERGVSPFICVFGRGITQTPIIVGWFLIRRTESPLGPRNKWLLIFIRATSTVLAICLYYTSITIIPLGDAVVINLTSTIFGALWAFVLLREKIGWVEVAAMSLSVVGVALVARPPVIFGKSEDITAVNQFIGVGLGIGAAISDGLGFALTRKITAKVRPMTLMLFASVECIIVGVPASYITGGPDFPGPWQDWMLYFTLTVTAFFGQILLVKSLQLGKAGRVTVGNYFSVVFAFMWGACFLDDPLYWTSFVGAILISANAIVTTYKGWRSIFSRRSDTAVEMSDMATGVSTNLDDTNDVDQEPQLDAAGDEIQSPFVRM